MLSRLLKMSALRQSLVLSLAFLVLLGVGGMLLGSYVSRQLQADIDADLRAEFAQIRQDLQAIGHVPDGFADGFEFLTDDFGTGFRRGDGTVLGPTQSGVFQQPGLQTIADEDLFSPSTLTALYQALDTAQDDTEYTSYDLPIGWDFDGSWRVLSGPVLDGQMVVFTPMVSGVVADLSSIILIAVVLLSLPTLGIGILFGLRAQRRLDRIGQGYERIAEGDLSVRLAPQVVRDDLDVLTQRIDSATEQLETTMRQMSEFSANIAHDLRTPLTRLRALLDQGAASDMPETYLEICSRQSDKIIAIFDAIQRIARLKTGDRRAKFQPVELEDVVMQAHEIYEAVAEDAGRTLICKLSDPDTAYGDRELLLQLLANLIENAIRHTEPGATITLTLDYTTLTVADNGPGIPESERAKVFEPLYRVDRARSTPGAGLGLALVKAIADLHGADIRLSDQQPGLCVTLDLPPVYNPAGGYFMSVQ